MASIFDSIEKGLDAWGFDLCQPFSIEDYNENVPDINKIPSMGRKSTLAILVGNSRNVWEHFIDAMVKDDALFQNENPLDEYTKRALESVLSNIHIHYRVYYTFKSREVPSLNYQLIAEISGMCKRSYQSKMCYHYKYGHWIGLRAVIVLDHSFVYNLSTKHMQDFQICRLCDQKYGERLDYLWRDKTMIAKYRNPSVWRSWLTLRTICTHNQYNYSYEEACYHYSKNRKVLEREVERFRKGDRTQRYDWMEEFNRDPEHYRLEDDLFVCENTRRRRRRRRWRRIVLELIQLVGFVEFFETKTVHFSNIHCPDLNNDDDEKTEEEGKGRSAGSAHSIPHFLFSFHGQFGGAFRPVREERQGDYDDKCDYSDHISPSHILLLSIPAKAKLTISTRSSDEFSLNEVDMRVNPMSGMPATDKKNKIVSITPK